MIARESLRSRWSIVKLGADDIRQARPKPRLCVKPFLLASLILFLGSGGGYIYAGGPGVRQSDCNENGVEDGEDIASSTSQDCNLNGIPDECEVPPLDPEGPDCNRNGIPDECEPDRDGDHVIDDCDNCRSEPNPDQADGDGDRIGDACDNCPEVDIMPDVCPNRLNPLRPGKALRVAVVGSKLFNVKRVDKDSLTLMRVDGVGDAVALDSPDALYRSVLADVAGPADPCRCPTPDHDGIIDLVLLFPAYEVVDGLELQTVPRNTHVRVILQGTMLDGNKIEALDCLLISGPQSSPRKRARPGR